MANQALDIRCGRETRASPRPAAGAAKSSRPLAHVPAKWTPVRRQEHAPIKESRAYSDSEGTEYALRHSGLICTLRNFTVPSPYCSAIGPSLCSPLRAWAVFCPLNTMARSRPFAVISIVFHLPPAFGIGLTSA